ncbi:hypothetical protein FOPG_20141 [Fusarium oxysporum f. sp. conglutinans race 2 54008]|uniref:Uncharacterized protein n=1 Tax=Fusarium oxysporum f. sp. conglutinans race 2 54008 TaxID=1089457 RepID=X0GUI2_FUSOX|nr:hypothetical protein FOPG_20141 [Fusarium oxysporum f. sp. conglutinans race 2 54008]
MVYMMISSLKQARGPSTLRTEYPSFFVRLNSRDALFRPRLLDTASFLRQQFTSWVLSLAIPP